MGLEKSRELDLIFILDMISKGKVLDEGIESCFVEKGGYNAKYARLKLVPIYRGEVVRTLKERVEVMTKLDELLGKAGLDRDWMVAAVSFAIQDILVQRTAEKLGIQIKEDGRFKNTPKLLTEIEPPLKDKGLKTTYAKIAKAYSEDFRNDVIHRGSEVDEKRAAEILNNTMGLLNLFLELPKKFKLVIKEDWGYKEPEG